MQRSLLKTRWSFQGASSSVGLAAIQIANSVGAKSIALTRTNAKRKQLIDGGAKYVIATEEEDLARGAQDAAGVTPLFGKLVADGSTPIQGRIGINTGEVVVRSIQTGAGQVEYTPIGHTTNLAARMQTAAPVGSIAASEATRKLCEGAISSSSRSARPKSKASANRSTFTRSPAWARYERGFSIQSAAA